MTTIGVLGRRWRAAVTPWGAIDQWDGLPRLDWYVAADDRWHRPAEEPTVRQTLVEGTPVVETRLRIPNGDAIQRVYAIADHGGLTVIEVTNESPLPIAVAFTGVPVRSVRPPAAVPIEGIDLPAGTPLFPIGHHATLVVAIDHADPGAPPRVGEPLPSGLPPALQVARGWLQMVERASRLVLPDAALAERVTAARCELLLGGVALPEDDPVGFLLGVHEAVRCGDAPGPWLPELAEAVGRVAREPVAWDVEAALDAAAHVLHLADERRALKDLAALRDRRAANSPSRTGAADPPVAPGPTDALELDPARFVAAVERTLVSGPHLFPAGIPPAWWGQHFEAHRLPTGPSSTVSFAVRWHGPRPALLWESTGEVVTLDAPVAAPGWVTAEHAGETLWPAPVGAEAGAGADVDTGSSASPSTGATPSAAHDDPPTSFS